MPLRILIGSTTFFALFATLQVILHDVDYGFYCFAIIISSFALLLNISVYQPENTLIKVAGFGSALALFAHVVVLVNLTIGGPAVLKTYEYIPWFSAALLVLWVPASLRSKARTTSLPVRGGEIEELRELIREHGGADGILEVFDKYDLGARRQSIMPRWEDPLLESIHMQAKRLANSYLDAKEAARANEEIDARMRVHWRRRALGIAFRDTQNDPDLLELEAKADELLNRPRLKKPSK